MSGNVTNLGNQAQTNILIADTQVRSPNHSQPSKVVGSAATPSATITQAYVAGFNKYVFYSPLTTATAINTDFEITGIPAGFAGLYSSISATMAVPTTAFTTHPIISVAHQYLNTTTGAFYANPISSTSPAFSTGTAYLKTIIQFTLD